jgi:hypothetical protein
MTEIQTIHNQEQMEAHRVKFKEFFLNQVAPNLAARNIPKKDYPRIMQTEWQNYLFTNRLLK